MPKQAKTLEDFIAPWRVTDGRKFRLKDYDPGSTKGFTDKDAAGPLLANGIQMLAEQQEKLYAQDRWALLLIFQAMDAAGKDGTIKHVMSGINPQGVQVYSFKAPSTQELDHDFMWRTTMCTPERGRIGIFNRSYYEEVLVVKVHPEYLARQRLPDECTGKKIWEHRYEDINAYEKYLSRNGVVIRKFFLNVSRDEQRKRFLSRLEDPHKNWKFSTADLAERAHWDHYMDAYQEMIRSTSTEHAPWYVVPADSKWYTRLVVGSVVLDTLRSLKLDFPKVDAAKRKELAAIRDQVRKEK
ncbi:MAG: polyphosphate kinase 2 family protein [Phycisphaerales bacterium]